MRRRAVSAFAAAAVAAAALASATVPAAASQGGPSAPAGDITKLIVKFEPGVPAADANGNVAGTDELPAADQALKNPHFIGLGYYTVDLPAPTSQANAHALAKRLEATSKVKIAEIDGTMSIADVQSNPPSWGLDRIDQPSLPLDSSYSYANSGAGVTAYIVDTGITTGNWTDYQGRRGTGADFVGDGNGTNDCNGHGSHVAGTVGGTLYGVAKAVTLVPVRVLACTGSGSWSGIISAMQWIVNDHVAGAPAVMNMSIGGAFAQSVNDAVTAAINDGVVAAIASGNGNTDACTTSPASTPLAITVNASGNYGGGSPVSDGRASFSNYGSCTDIYAPGVNITSDWNSSAQPTNTISGTSMATPHVAGVAAVILGDNPTWTPAQVLARMLAIDSNVVSSGITGDPTGLLQVPTIPPVAAGAGTPGSVTGTPTASGSLRFSWTAASGYPAPTYSVTSITPSVSIPAGCTNTTNLNCSISGLANGTTYTVTVQASNSGGTGSAASGSGTPVAATTAPTGLTATRNPATQVSVNWAANPADQGVTGYTLRAYTSSTTATVVGTCNTANTSCGFTGLTSGTTYWFAVTATNAFGSSTSARVAAYSAPTVPRSVSVTAGTKTATVRWSAPTSNGGSTIIRYVAIARASNSATGVVRTTCQTTSVAPATPALTCTFPANSLPTGTSYVEVQAFNTTTAGAISTRVAVSIA